MDLYIYDETITPIAICDDFTSLLWTTRYNSAGGFKLTVPATDKNVKNLQKYRYIYRQDVGEAMSIYGIQEENNNNGSKMLTITGKSLDGLFRKRMIPQNVDNNSLLTTLSRCMDFGCPIEYDYSVDCKPPLKSSYNHQTTAEEYMRMALKQNNYGFSLQINPAEKCMVAKILVGKDLSESVMFSEENISNSMYEYSDDNSATCIFGKTNEPAEDVERPNGLPIYNIGTEITGLKRSELNVSVDAIIKTGYRVVNDQLVEYEYVDYDATLELLIEKCKAAVSPPSENFNGDINANKFRKIFNIGDIVGIQNNKRNILLTKRAEEVEESFTRNGIYVTPTFGEPLKTIFDYIGVR